MRKVLLAGLLLVGTNLVAYAQTNSPKPAYDFSLPREERIKLAESAAPPEISGKLRVSPRTDRLRESPYGHKRILVLCGPPNSLQHGAHML